MRKLIAIVMALIIILPMTAFAEPSLGMTFARFIELYNSVSAPLGAPYVELNEPVSWTKFGDNDMAIFDPDNSGNIYISLITYQKRKELNLSCPLDEVYVLMYNPKDYAGFFSIGARVANIFRESYDVVSAEQYVMYVIQYFYEHKLFGTGMHSYQQINYINDLSVCFEQDSSASLIFVKKGQ